MCISSNFPNPNFIEKDLQQAGGVLPVGQMLEELTEECVRLYEIWIWKIKTYTMERTFTKDSGSSVK
tara:strand:+ start:487 stop:687 length:201 start_codon:yes stop_codon:yes gene_type:complete